MFAFVYNRPPLFAACHPFTEVAWIFYGKFDHLHPPMKLVAQGGPYT